MTLNLPVKVRTTCEAVAKRSKHVRINREKIEAYAMTLPLDQAIIPELDPNTHYLNQGDDTLSFFLILDAINFGSGYFPHLKKRPGMSGYFTVASSLSDYFKKHGPFHSAKLKTLGINECTEIFGQDTENAPIQELMQLFATAMNDLGKYLIDYFNGSFVELVKAADSSAKTLMELLIKMPFYDDVEHCRKMEVHFYKRAQLTAADLSLALKGEGLGTFTDLDELTIFADNLVPHVLRIDGILLYEEDLERRIDSEQLILSGSEEEVEIRACAVHAVELMAKALQESGQDVTSHGPDYLLWNRGQNPYYKKIKPRHRTRTVFY